MKTEKEVRERIERVTRDYKHVLECGPATIQINAPRALMQVESISILDVLYWTLGEKRPTFICDDSTKLDM